MDSLLLLANNKDEKLNKLLARMGYDVLSGDSNTPIAQLISGASLDLIVLDSELDDGAQDLCEFLRKDEVTKHTPILYISRKPEHLEELKKLSLEKVEVLEKVPSPGLLVSKIATQLRMRKIAGQDENTATLGEVNAALRDLNQRFQKEREEAKNIQLSLLPEELPKDPRFDVAVSYDPLEDVGGDWYFIQKEKSGCISMLIADVTGHGLSAAFIGCMTKLALSAAGEESPSKRLAAMNNLMTPCLPPGRFVTMDSVLYDPSTGKATVTRAGHPPCVLVRKNTTTVEKVGGEGFAVGFMPDSDYTEQEASMEVGDMLVLVTDGITEAQNRANKMYGFDRLAETIRKCSGTSTAAEILKTVLDDLEVFCEGRILKDDVTVIVLKRNG